MVRYFMIISVFASFLTALPSETYYRLILSVMQDTLMNSIRPQKATINRDRHKQMQKQKNFALKAQQQEKNRYPEKSVNKKYQYGSYTGGRGKGVKRR